MVETFESRYCTAGVATDRKVDKIYLDDQGLFGEPTFLGTVCPGSSDPFHIVSYFMKWVTTSWTHGNFTDTPISTGERGGGMFCLVSVKMLN